MSTVKMINDNQVKVLEDQVKIKKDIQDIKEKSFSEISKRSGFQEDDDAKSF